MNVNKLTLILIASVLPAGAWAHHSFGMFDHSKEITLVGTVKEFQWTNPHTWIQLVVQDPKTGQTMEWGIEGSPTTSLKRRGWTRDSVKTGDKAVITLNPLRSGAPGGSLVKITIDGKLIGGNAT